MNGTADASTETKKITPWRVACLAAIASLWGMSELLGGPTLRVRWGLTPSGDPSPYPSESKTGTSRSSV